MAQKARNNGRVLVSLVLILAVLSSVSFAEPTPANIPQYSKPRAVPGEPMVYYPQGNTLYIHYFD